MHEDPPAPKEEQLPGHTEVILSEFKRRAEDVRHLDTTDPEIVSMTLHQGLERLSASPILEKYEAGMIPTLASLARAADEARAVLLEDADDEEAAKLARLLEGSVHSIKDWTRKYVASILRFHKTKSSYFRVQTKADEIHLMEEADKDRRRIHNALLSSLSAFNQQLEDAHGIDTFAPAIEWVPGIDQPTGTADTMPLVFSKAAIADRDLIKNWAIAADLGEEIKKILKGLSPQN